MTEFTKEALESFRNEPIDKLINSLQWEDVLPAFRTIGDALKEVDEERPLPYHNGRHQAEVAYLVERLDKHYGEVYVNESLFIAALTHDYNYGLNTRRGNHAPTLEMLSFYDAVANGLYESSSNAQQVVITYALIRATEPSFRPILRLDSEEVEAKKDSINPRHYMLYWELRELHAIEEARMLSDADMSFAAYLSIEEHNRSKDLLKQEGIVLGKEYDLSDEKILHFLEEIAGPPFFPVKDDLGDSQATWESLVNHYKELVSAKDSN